MSSFEGYTLTGRHGIWSSYESPVHTVDSMINQHAKGSRLPSVAIGASLFYSPGLLSSHVWRQDHNGILPHQILALPDIMLNKKLNNDHDTQISTSQQMLILLLAVGEKCYTSTNVNAVILLVLQPAQWVTLADEAREGALQLGAKEWKWAQC